MALAAAPDKAAYWDARGNTYAEAGKSDQALADFNEAIRRVITNRAGDDPPP